MPMTRRYTPEIVPGETCQVGMDFSFVIPPGVNIVQGAMTVWANVVPPGRSDELAAGPVTIRGRTLYAPITATGAALGKDYQLRWQATDSQGNVWPRTALLLCAQTS